jgi:tetratricopeptide (TPR) repeat protein
MRYLRHSMLVLCLLAPLSARGDEAQIRKATDALAKGDFQAAAGYCRQAFEADPKDSSAYYTLGVVRWAQSYRAVSEAKKSAGIGAAEAPPIRDAALRDKLRISIAASLAEGHKSLGQALALEPGFGYALLYQNLLYRLDAEVANSESEAKELLARADDQIKAALALKEQGKWKNPTAPVPPPPPPPPPPKR